MAGERNGPDRNQQGVFAATLARVVDAKRRHDARRSGGPPGFALFGRANRADAPDPVSVAVFAIDQVGPAAVRACASGVEVRILAADAATAAVIRAALAETARRRPTDRLIRVVSD